MDHTFTFDAAFLKSLMVSRTHLQVRSLSLQS